MKMNLSDTQFAVLNDAAFNEISHWWAGEPGASASRWYVTVPEKCTSPMTPYQAAAASQCVEHKWLQKINEFRSRTGSKTVQYRISPAGKIELQLYEKKLARQRGHIT